MQRKRSPRRGDTRPAEPPERPEAGPGEATDLHARLQELQNALQESEDRFQQLFNNADDIVYMIDLQGRFTAINKTAERVVGYTNEEARGRHYSFVLAPESLERAKEMVARKLAGGGPTTYELNLLTKDGRRVPIELSSQIIVVRGKPVGIQGIALDITERKKTESALRESETRFRSVAQSTSNGIIVADGKGTIIFWNAAAHRIFGYAAEEVLGQPLSMLMPLRYRDPHQRAFEQVRATGHSRLAGQTLEFHGLHKDGREFPLELSLASWTVGDDTFYSGIVRDITDRRRAEEQNKHQLERITALYGLAELLSQTLDQHTLAENVVRSCVDSFGVTLAWLARTHPSGSLSTLAHYPESDLPEQILSRWDDPLASQGVVSRAVRSGTPAIALDVAGEPQTAPGRAAALALTLKSVATFPLVSRDKTLGALTLYSDQPAFFTPERIDFFRACAHQVTAAMENARLYDQAEARLQQLQALRDIDMAISGSLDLRLTLGIMLDAITAQLRVDAAVILLYNDQMHTLEFGAGRGFRTAVFQHAHIRLGEGHAGRAALTRRAVRNDHLAMDPGDFSRAPLLTNEGFVSYLGVPLIAKGHLKGVLELFNRTPLAPPGAGEWQEALDGLVGQAAIAIDNAALFDDLQRSNLDLALAYDTTLEGWSRALDLRDRETEGHSQRVAEMTLRLARALAVSGAELPHIRRGALLHDMGKIAVPDAILLKPGPLTPDEWTVMRQHPVTAYELISPIAFLRPALDIPYCHHEKWDGTGYPRGLRGEAIPIAARIFAVADVWDALRSDRPYRRAWTEERARAYIAEQGGEHFDPRMVEAFLRLVGGESN